MARSASRLRPSLDDPARLFEGDRREMVRLLWEKAGEEPENLQSCLRRYLNDLGMPFDVVGYARSTDELRLLTLGVFMGRWSNSKDCMELVHEMLVGPLPNEPGNRLKRLTRRNGS